MGSRLAAGTTLEYISNLVQKVCKRLSITFEHINTIDV